MFQEYNECARLRRALGILASLFITVCGSSPAYSQCSGTPPNDVVEAMVALTTDSDAVSCATAIRDCGEFVITWESPQEPSFNFDNALRVRRYQANGTPMGNPAVLNAAGAGRDPSIAMSGAGFVQIGWVGIQGIFTTHANFELIRQDFDFDLFNVVAVAPPFLSDGDGDHEPSVGASDAMEQMENVDAVTWSNHFVEQGLLYDLDGMPVEIRDCAPFCHVDRWEPCLAMRSSSDAYFALAWADAETAQNDPPFNIALQIYDSDGTLVAELAGPDVNDPSQWVNDPSLEDLNPEFDSIQLSPALSFVGNDVVVVWVGAAFVGCDDSITNHVYARRFKFDLATNTLRDPDPMLGEGRPGAFVVDNDADERIVLDVDKANPTVALTLETGANAGRFLVAWNNRIVHPEFGTTIAEEVRGQFFDVEGLPRGEEFRVHLDTSNTDTNPNRAIRRLSDSAQHTIAYGGQDQAISTWIAGEEDPLAHYTVLPPGHADTLGGGCCKGDLGGNNALPVFAPDGLRDGRDIQPFTNVMKNPKCADPLEFCRADMNSDFVLDELDIMLFVATILQTEPCTQGLSGGGSGGESAAMEGEGAGGLEVPAESGGGAEGAESGEATAGSDAGGESAPQPVVQDCDADGVSDADEIAGGPGAPGDCNGDGYPDVCNLALVVFTSYDCNDNGVPDECELEGQDDNANGFLDACEPGGGLPVAGEASTEALVQFYEWSIGQTWGPASGLTGADQFQAVINRLEEVGLPIENPWLSGQ